MNDGDKRPFNTLLNNAGELYSKDLTPGVKQIYWNTLRKYDFRAIADAFGRHASNPDTGTFMPKPADIIKMLEGNTQDSGMRAWAKVERAIRTVGGYRTAAFDDPLIHRVISDMGGWIKLCGTEADALPFVAKEFIDRYRGFTIKSERPEYPRTLTGRVDADRQVRGLPPGKVALIGDETAAKAVLAGGSDAPPLTYTEHKAEALPGGNKAIENKSAGIPQLQHAPARAGRLAQRIQEMAQKAGEG